MSRTGQLGALLASLAVVAAVVATASGDTGRGHPASASAAAYARSDLSGTSGFVSVNGNGEKGGQGTHARASTHGGKGSASASATVRGVDIFDGLVTASAVTVRAAAGGNGTSTSGSISGLVINGKTVPAPAGYTTYDMGGYGQLVALGSGASGVLGLSARLTKAYKSHKAGETARVAYASAKAQDEVKPAAPPAPKKRAQPAPKEPQTHAHKAKRAKRAKAKAQAKAKARPQISAKEKLERALTADERARATLLLGMPGYASPVAGEHQFTDTFGAPRSDVPVHIGNDIFAAFGTPIVAVADGRLYRVGTLKISGNRLWLRDRKGYRYFYAHLSDFAAAAYNGADVHAGEVIGFVGNTGDAEPTPPHLHFEVHMPDGAVVDPYPYLAKWDQSGVSSASWVRRYGKDPGVRPGALVVVKDFLAEP